eukprot:m.297462 g.297462  ORF g.297462 m.297462 type:complete len:54 (+) comp15858_c6_seq31:1557-1718(+)
MVFKRYSQKLNARVVVHVSARVFLGETAEGRTSNILLNHVLTIIASFLPHGNR